ncbi:hypothetical protein QJS04_geneDACA004511 [Acorus gramineus]|uniref:Bet v I/Major latex protein domain-containing protein n=1 Tax=Acorus gramineus TaxID=55184 RepID=A0AAV9BT17_ACOGR|nr:hypothetical protein QJS04_geneDACA004511 [Acorus gramineus]
MIIKGFNCEFVSPVSASRMFKAGVVDSQNLSPKIAPAIIKDIVVVEGDGKAGSTIRVNFTKESNFGSVKERIDVLDEEKFAYKYTLVEGGRIGEAYESATYEVRFEPRGDDRGCVCRVEGVFNAYSDDGFGEEEIGALRDAVVGKYRAVEAFLIGNPEAYV